MRGVQSVQIEANVLALGSAAEQRGVHLETTVEDNVKHFGPLQKGEYDGTVLHFHNLAS